MRIRLSAVVSSFAGAASMFVSIAVASAQTLPSSAPIHIHLVSSSVNPPSVTAIYNLAGLTGGYFTKNGLDVELQQSSGSPTSLAAIVSGKAEFASINLAVLANAASQGIKAKTFVIGNFDNIGMLVSKDSIRSPKDLEGKIMAASVLGSSEYNAPRTYFAHQGIDIDKIHWVSSGNESTTVQALVAGRIDAAYLHVAAMMDAFKANPSLKILVEPAAFSKVAPSTGAIAVVTDAYAEAHPDVVTAFTQSLIAASRRLYQDRSFFDAVTETWMPGIYSDAQKTVIYNAYHPSWGVNGGLEMRALESVLDGWKESNPKGATNPYFSRAADLVDTRFAKTALDRLGLMKGALDDAAWYETAQ
ncbi:MAG TPA: ABC transporter substrate-binding protein [Beijerinckiaceae bacterium]|nr:ABC transporter substrate-binding protein [Beijerinckiaceae bacterium]